MMQSVVARALPAMLPMILEVCGAVTKQTKAQSRAPVTKAAAASISPPPNMMQNPAEPTADPSICPQLPEDFIFLMAVSLSRAWSMVRSPSAMSLESWFTSATLCS